MRKGLKRTRIPPKLNSTFVKKVNMPNFCKDYYDYWDSFINEWRCFTCSKHLFLKKRKWDKLIFPNLTKFTYPDFYNAHKGNDTIDYLPEPWWGNDGTHPLSAVVINLNPGEGGDSQLRTNLPRFSRYSRYVSHKVDDFVNNRELKIYLNNKSVRSTTEWLLLKRALPIFRAFPDIPFQSVENVLAVELLPWHSRNFGDTGKYYENNVYAIYEKSIKFALEASEHVCYLKLRNIVFARVNLDVLTKILGKEYRPIKYNNNILIFKIVENGKTYHIIANKSSYNNLPAKEGLIDIVTKINNKIY